MGSDLSWRRCRLVPKLLKQVKSWLKAKFLLLIQKDSRVDKKNLSMEYGPVYGTEFISHLINIVVRKSRNVLMKYDDKRVW